MSETTPSSPSIDLVLATVDRTFEVGCFLESLACQTYRGFRLIVVDQNADRRLARILDAYDGAFSISRIASARGLSRARNAGLGHRQGDVVAFPDDDCRYPPDLLANVVAMLGAHPEWDGVTGRAVDDSGRPSSARWALSAGKIGRYNVWRRALSITIFLRQHVIETVGPYDESLGAGSGTPFGSSEETDYLLRALNAGFSLYYDPSLTVIHPDNRSQASCETIEAGQVYGAGMGRVLRKHHYPSWFAFYHVGRAVAGALLGLVNQRPPGARFHWAVARGRLRGWLSACS